MTTMERAPDRLMLGGEMTVNRLGYGAMHLTGPGMWGEVADPEAAIALLRRAIDLGVTFIDTADSYGPATNEQLIRRALHPYPDDVVLCTKGGLLRSGPRDWEGATHPYIVPLGRPEYLRQQVELSLRNLGVERIDLYQLHSIDPAVPLEDQLGELARLREQGKIRHIGISGQPEVTVDQLDAARAITDIIAVENLYNIADRAGSDALKYAERHGIAFIPWFPLGHGGLVGPASPLRSIAAAYDLTPAQLALAWLLHHSPATLPIPGTTSIGHLEQNLQAATVAFTDADLEHITRAVDEAGITTWRPTREPS